MIYRFAKLSEQATYMQAKLLETRAAEFTMHCQLEAANCQVTALTGQLANTRGALKKLARKTLQTKAALWVQVAAVQELLSAVNAHIESLERECVAET